MNKERKIKSSNLYQFYEIATELNTFKLNYQRIITWTPS